MKKYNNANDSIHMTTIYFHYKHALEMYIDKKARKCSSMETMSRVEREISFAYFCIKTLSLKRNEIAFSHLSICIL